MPSVKPFFKFAVQICSNILILLLQTHFVTVRDFEAFLRCSMLGNLPHLSKSQHLEKGRLQNYRNRKVALSKAMHIISSEHHNMGNRSPGRNLKETIV